MNITQEQARIVIKALELSLVHLPDDSVPAIRACAASRAIMRAALESDVAATDRYEPLMSNKAFWSLIAVMVMAAVVVYFAGVAP